MLTGFNMKIFNEIHHVAIIVSDYLRARAFYVDTLGFEVVRENYRERQNDWKLDIRAGDVELEIFGKPDAPARLPGPEPCGYRHLAFRVPDVAKAAAELRKRGVECEPIRTDEFTHNSLTFFHDPEGNVFELHE